MMFDKMWKGIFLCCLLLVGDPFVNLNVQTQNDTTVPPVEVAQ